MHVSIFTGRQKRADRARAEYDAAVAHNEKKSKALTMKAVARAEVAKLPIGPLRNGLEVIGGKADLIVHRAQTLDLDDACDLYEAVALAARDTR